MKKTNKKKVKKKAKAVKTVGGHRPKPMKTKGKPTPPTSGTGIVPPNERDRLNIKVPSELKVWAMEYAARHCTTVTQIVINHLNMLKQHEEMFMASDVEQI